MTRRLIRSALIVSALAGAALLLSACLPGTGGGLGGGGGFNLPPVPIVTSDSVRGVVPLTVRFSSDASTDDGVIVARQWDFGDGATSPEISPTHTFLTTGDFLVRLTLTDDDGLTSSRTLSVSVTQAPVSVISVDRTSAPSAPATINFDGRQSSDPDGSIQQYQWDFGDDTRLFVDATPHTYSQPGTYRAELTVTDDKGVTNTSSVIISIGIPQPSIEFRVPPATVQNIVVSPQSPLWVQGVFESLAGVPRTIRAGLDGDRDPCQAQSIVYNATTGTTNSVLTGHSDRVVAAAYTPDGTLVLTGAADRNLRLHNASTGALVQSYAAVLPFNSLAFAPSGAEFAYGQSNGQIVVRRRSDGATLRTLSGHTGAVNALAYSPAGDRIVSGSSDRRVIIWDAASGAQLSEYSHGLAVNSISVDASRIASGSEDQTIIIRALSGAAVTTLTGHNAPVNAVAFSRSGNLLASGGDDNNVILWDGASFAFVRTLAGHTDDVSAVAFSADGLRLSSGSVDGSTRLWDVASGRLERTLRTCASAITSVAFAPDGGSVLTAVGARNDIQLDTIPPNGNDLNFSVPQALDLSKVPPGQFSLWVEIDTDRSLPVRAYANPAINVVSAFASAAVANAPVVPLVNDQAVIVANANASRQIFDLGSATRGDRLFLSFVSTPGYRERYEIDQQYSVMLLNSTQEIFAWYQQFGDVFNGFSRAVLFSPQSVLVVAESTPNLYVVVDSAADLSVRFQRDFGFAARGQRVFVNFAGATGVAVGGDPATTIPALNAADFNQFFVTSPNWGANETALLKSVILQTLNTAYAGFNIQFFNSDTTPITAVQPPFLTAHIGGDDPFSYGTADYIDPRNETTTGTSITFATGIAADGIRGFFANPISSVNALGVAIGTVAAHEIGHCLGLRHTDDAADLMQGAADPTIPRQFRAAAPSASEQLLGLPPIGVQNAPELLEQVLGLSP